jgi:hypothetical protein
LDVLALDQKFIALAFISPTLFRLRLELSSLRNFEAIEHGDFGEIQEESKHHCRRECPSHNDNRQGSHGDPANRQS